jgi:hypothetical protein
MWGSTGGSSAVNLTVSVVALALGVTMIWVGSPKGGVSPAFMRNGFMEMIYPVACLSAFVVGMAGILSALPWSFF